MAVKYNPYEKIIEERKANERRWEIEGRKSDLRVARHIEKQLIEYLDENLQSTLEYWVDKNVGFYYVVHMIDCPDCEYPEDRIFEIHITYNGKEIDEQYFIDMTPKGNYFNLSSIKKGNILHKDDLLTIMSEMGKQVQFYKRDHPEKFR